MSKFRIPRKRKTMSSCCILNEAGTQYTCIDSLTETECIYREGLWSGLSGGNPVWCSSKPCPEAPRSVDSSNSVTDSASITPKITTKLNSINIGDEFEGGIYVGKFKPGTPINGNGIEINGNEFTGEPQLYTSRGHGAGGKNSKEWALIIDNVNYEYRGKSKKPFPKDYKIFATSFYDGHYNTFGGGKLFRGLNSPLIDEIKKYKKNGYSDWYIPSQDELAFLNWTFRYTDLGKTLNNGNPKFEKMIGTYHTSTIFSHRDITDPENISIRKQNIKGKKYLYSQQFNTTNKNQEGFVQLIPNEKIVNPGPMCYLRLVRRILL